jgi:putative ABC transport system permease protein
MQITLLLSKDFLKLVGIASILAFPIAWWIMDRWLNNFEYRMPLHWWIFALAGVLAAVIAWCTVGVQAYRAATANPVEALKKE